MKFTIPKIYPITDTRISGLSHLEQVRRLISGGASFIQLRDKDAPSGDFYRAALECVEHAHANGARIIINDRADIALAAGADGVHLGQDDLDPKHARSLLGASAIIGYSTHSLEQARAALGYPIDYLAIGPVFETQTKKDHDPVIGLEGLRALRDLEPGCPIVAIGGIDLQNAASVLAAGADSIALVSSVVSQPSLIAERMKELLQL